MAVYGIVAEYNPFHNGHAYQIEKIRDNKDCDGIVAVMSGNFVQRGQTAILPKLARAKMALLNGVDLVIELPVAYATASAERFSQASIFLLNALGVVDKLSFGSECGNIESIQSATKAVLSDAVEKQLQIELQKGVSYPVARQNAVTACFGEDIGKILESPNNILAVEYCKALVKYHSKIQPTTIIRVGANHDDKITNAQYASASALREKIIRGESIKPFVPQNVSFMFEEELQKGFAPSSMKNLETPILSALRLKTAKDFSLVPDIAEGMENRILSATKTANSLETLYDTAKTKRYTHSRIRRAVLCAFLGITKQDVETHPPYLRVLGFTQKGKELLRLAKKNATLPIVMSAADVKKLDAIANHTYALESKCTDIYNMSLPKIRPCGTEMTDNFVRLE